MKRRLMRLAALGLLALMTACATGPGTAPSGAAPASGAPSAASGLRVTGTVSYLQRVALPPDSDVIVQLRDISRLDSASGVLAEQRFTASSQVPLPFELTVEPGKIDPRMRYAVAARIQRNGKLLFINDKLYLVLTQGHGNRVEMILHMVAKP